MSAAVGATIPFAHLMPGGLIPAALAQSDQPFVIPGKEGLIVLNDRPINAETPAHLLDDRVTPGKYLFVRNNGREPSMPSIDPASWALEVGGESAERTASFSIDELKETFRHYTYQLQIECGGNGRSEFVPPAAGNQWSVGAVGCPQWTGVRLRDVLEHVGIKDDAVYVAYYGADAHASGDPNKVPISRGVPLAKALEKESLIAWAMNDEDIPHLNGYPLRLVCASWHQAKLEKTEVEFPESGYYEVWARATDSEGRAQPMVLPGWNPKGYLNNACHRIAVQVA
ncbi:MAG: molybdopterin-dependent oxidoreductase [Gammaproteobacteria bacterium]|nr:molybdopterin-dependent oxidoreductase [Gammaproteobacteria bacterium]